MILPLYPRQASGTDDSQPAKLSLDALEVPGVARDNSGTDAPRGESDEQVVDGSQTIGRLITRAVEATEEERSSFEEIRGRGDDPCIGKRGADAIHGAAPLRGVGTEAKFHEHNGREKRTAIPACPKTHSAERSPRR